MVFGIFKNMNWKYSHDLYDNYLEGYIKALKDHDEFEK